MKTQLSNFALAAALFAVGASAASAETLLAPGESQAGELTRESQRMYENDYYLDAYSVSGEAGERIAISMQSDDFDTLIEIGQMVDGSFQQLAMDDDGGGGLNSRLVFTFPQSGDYIVRARTFGANSVGGYQIEAGPIAPPAPPPDPIRIRSGQTRTGTLSVDTATYQADGYGAQGRHYALYNLRGRAGDAITVTLRSSDFDAFLEVGGMTPLGYAVVLSNDDGAANDGEESLGLDSRLTVTFARSGTMTIRATTLGGGATGSYSLSID